MLSALVSVDDRVTGLAAGADETLARNAGKVLTRERLLEIV